MIVFIDFSSYGDAVFYLDYWKKAFKHSEVNGFFIYHNKGFVFSNNNLGLPLIFNSDKLKLFHFIYKFCIQFLVIFILTAITHFRRRKIHIIFNLHQPFIFWNWLLKFSNSRKTNKDVIVHDLFEFDTSNYPRFIISTNQKIISKSDTVILHNGVDIFKKIYGHEKNIECLPFPLRTPYLNSEPLIDSKYFYIPGKYRKEKGFDFVINNWPRDSSKILVISTTLPEELREIIKVKKNILYKPTLIASDEFQNLIANSYACLLMYESGTNSGVLTTIIANNIRCLVSDIAMFRNHPQSKKLKIAKLNSEDFIRSLESLDTSEKPDYLDLDKIEDLKKYEYFLKSRLC